MAKKRADRTAPKAITMQCAGKICSEDTDKQAQRSALAELLGGFDAIVETFDHELFQLGNLVTV